MKTKYCLIILVTIGFSLIGLNQTRLAKQQEELKRDLLELQSLVSAMTVDITPRKIETPLAKDDSMQVALAESVSALEEQMDTVVRAMDEIQVSAERGSRNDRSWGEEQALGEPNTFIHCDLRTAWASKDPNGGEEWLQVNFDDIVSATEVNVHETFNPGAISKISAIMPDGSERIIWEGILDPEEDPQVIEQAFQIGESIMTDSIKIYLDTARVRGWNEIDAVELVGAGNSRQWASGATASSTFAR